MSQSYESAPQAPPGPPPGGPSGPRAGFWARFAAYLLDGIIITVVGGIIFFVLYAISDPLAILGYIIWIVGGVGYFVYFEGGESGATPGKKALNIRVINADTGGQVGYGKAFIRYLGRILAGIPFYLGYLWMLWDREKQCWQDKIAGTFVVPTDAYR